MEQEKDDSVWLNEGWYKVLEFLGLKHEYFVVFKYNGESKFKFMVIRSSASKIDYLSLRSFHNDHPHINQKIISQMVVIVMETS
ncbi:hypothetical protein AAHE18_13G267800 [Arachis hypogaea]